MRAGVWPRRLGWAAAGLAWACMAVWLLAHPPALSSDDALFLMRGLTRFSLLDDSPQFPGYPGFIAMGRLLLPFFASPITALALLAGTIALSLPPVAALVVWRNAGAAAALLAFATTLAMPLLPELALGMLTDGAGILFTLVFLALLPRTREPLLTNRMVLAGIALGWAAACRPSDALMILAAGAGALVVVPRATLPLVVGLTAVVLPCAIVLLVLEPLYLSEGWRFVMGHTLFWGNTPFSEAPRGGTWWVVLRGVPTLPLPLLLSAAAALAALVRPGRAGPATTAAAAAFLGHGLWIAGFQNPDNLRHLVPLLIFGPLVLCLMQGMPAKIAAGVCLVAEVAALAAYTTFSPAAPPPLEAAATALANVAPDSAVATNLGVAVLRANLPRLRVYDSFYAADAVLGLSLAGGEGLRLTSTAPANPITSFPARFLGERSLWLTDARERQ